MKVAFSTIGEGNKVELGVARFVCPAMTLIGLAETFAGYYDNHEAHLPKNRALTRGRPQFSRPCSDAPQDGR